jgi:hypothetical protein
LTQADIEMNFVRHFRGKPKFVVVMADNIWCKGDYYALAFGVRVGTFIFYALQLGP